MDIESELNMIAATLVRFSDTVETLRRDIDELVRINYERAKKNPGEEKEDG